jgi:hypothetical protein
LGRRELGEKPKMWDAWVGKDREVFRDGGNVDSEKGERMSKWEGILVGFSSSSFISYYDRTNLFKLTNPPPADLSNLPKPTIHPLKPIQNIPKRLQLYPQV